MRTLTLEEAAEFLHLHPITLARRAKAGIVPGAKPGKCWVFVEVDLIEYLRSQYRRQTSTESMTKEKQSCHSIDQKSRRIGGSTLPATDDEYAKVLGLQKESRRRNSTTA